MSICLKEIQLARLSSARLASLAVQAAVLEAAATSKPGLVCMDTQGVHTDMDIRTLTAGACSLHAYFAQAAACGRRHAGAAPEDLFRRLRPFGRRAEKTMFAATGGVNTHKGLIFSQGLICAATGRLASRKGRASAAAICAEAAALAQGLVGRDLAPLLHTAEASPARQRARRGLSAGEAQYLRHGTAGARGEAERGFPHALLGLQSLWNEGTRSDFNRAVLHSLLALMAELHDTNLLWRGGPEKMRAVQTLARRVLELGGAATPAGEKALAELQGYCLTHRLSPGGCADMVSIAIFFSLLLADASAGPSAGSASACRDVSSGSVFCSGHVPKNTLP